MSAPGPGPVVVAVDLGTSSTCTAVSVPGQAPRVVLVDGGPLLPSAVHAGTDGLVVGVEAQRRAALDPAAHEPHPKRRVDEGTLLLGTAVVPVTAVLAAVLHRAVGEARATLGGRGVDLLVLTHPADWGGVRTGVLRAAAAGLARELTLLPEPVAAAVLHGQGSVDGTLLAVLDVGAGTTDVSVLRAVAPRGGARPGHEVLATGGDPGFGGADVDELLLAALGRRQRGGAAAVWQEVLAGGDPGRGDLAGRRALASLRAEVRAAKEALSRHAFTDVALPAGLPDAHVTRDELETLVGPRVRDVVALLARVLGRAGALEPDGRSRAAVHLVGGSSRLPVLAREVHRGLGVLPVTTDQPETVVARGAVLHAEAQLAARRAPRPAPARPGPPQPGPPQPARAPGPTPPPAPAARRPGRRRALVAGAVVAALAAGVLLVAQRTGGPGGAAPTGPATREVAVGGATVPVPADWAEVTRTDAPGTATGDTARVVLSPDGTTSAAAQLLVQQTRLAPGADAADVLGTLGSQVAAAGGRYRDLTGGASYAGRAVTTYTEELPGGGTVDWYVVLEPGSQVSVGCRADPADPAEVAAACQDAVGGVRAG